jgi:hypothetical protein
LLAEDQPAMARPVRCLTISPTETPTSSRTTIPGRAESNRNAGVAGRPRGGAYTVASASLGTRSFCRNFSHGDRLRPPPAATGTASPGSAYEPSS